METCYLRCTAGIFEILLQKYFFLVGVTPMKIVGKCMGLLRESVVVPKGILLGLGPDFKGFGWFSMEKMF